MVCLGRSFKMHSTVGMCVWYNNFDVWAYGPDAKVFFCALNYPMSWADRSMHVWFLPIIKKRLLITKSALTRGFQYGSVNNVFDGPMNEHMVWLLINNSNVIPCFTRPVSGICKDYKDFFLWCKKCLTSYCRMRKLALVSIV